ncbi:putative metallophosphoesterase [Caloramator mitchellensis]|uniref:Putative metallophosphoesterase n=1 Tax=Caloramator mitchellensis TaxID=908809 RepID=A0A0R3K269_CALMK|nr:metallophosphoesterase [Caloramator mitchellensis]KRQ87508.1 putative metallophosphoesterase [Caloramator mitchellensis]
MKLLQIFLIILVLSFYGLISYFIGLRGYKAFKIMPFFNPKVYWILFAIVVVSIFIVRILENHAEGRLYNLIEVISFYWMATIVYALLILLLYDIIGLLLRIGFANAHSYWIKPEFTVFRAIAAIILILGLFIYGNINSKNIKVVEYNLNINKKVEGINKLTIVMASDFHLGNIINDKRLKHFVETANGLKPDIVLLAGDIIDENPKVYDKLNMKNIFNRLNTEYGVYACLGNHEYFRGNTDDIVKSLVDGNIKVLRDEVVSIEDKFYIVGREDKTYDRLVGKRKSIEQLVDKLDKSKPIILLDHQPIDIENAIKSGVDIEVSGHTHKGQFFPIDLFTKRLFVKDYGHYTKGNYNLFVSSGYGTWGPPIRIGNSPEIVLIRVFFK